jgi:dienelactone hydrolase
MNRSVIVALGLALAALSAPALAQAPAAIKSSAALPSGVTLKEANWYSEQVRVSGRLFTPANFGTGPAAPAVVLAPGWGKTADTLDAYAAAIASQGMVALIVDYRGWGRSGGEIYLGQRVDTYDAQRFSEQTPDLVIRRGRLDPEHQVQDIRNAITFLQGEAGLDKAKIGVFGVDIGGGHVISVMGMDARAKVGVAVTPKIPGKNNPPKSFVPDAKSQAEMIQLAREGAPPKTAAAAKARNAQEAKLALSEYKPFWRLVGMPQTDAVRFIVASADKDVDNASNATAAAAAIKGPNDVKTLDGASHTLTAAQTAEAAKLSADWFKAQLGK